MKREGKHVLVTVWRKTVRTKKEDAAVLIKLPKRRVQLRWGR